jgi:PKD repeat protein
MEGTEYISDLDIYAEVGGNAAYVVETYVTVSDGELNIEFNTNFENAKINAIKVALAGLGAAFNYSPATPLSGQAVTFDASASADPDGTITAYSWGFGDGASSTGKTTTHTYSTAGDYRVTLTITDNEGDTASVTKTVTVYSDSEPRPFMEYIKPRPITCDLSYETWGVDGVLPRDLCNGIESARGAGIGPEYYYWDAQIIRAQDGKYHMFMSTWSGTKSFNPGWLESDAYHAISTQGVLGPYERQGYVYNENGSHKGHNVSALELQDGTYAVVISETRPFTIYTSASLDGPWTSCEPQLGLYQSNVSLIQRHDGRFQIVQRNGYIAIADSLCGNYVQQTPTTSYPTREGDSIYPRRDSIPRVDNPTFDWEEDPHIWRSGGVYHVIYSGSGDRVGYHLYSEDGINDWQDNGYAWSPREWERIFCFEDGTCNQWYKMERPGVVLEDGHPTHLTWAVSDVDKDNQIPGGSNHGSKIIVIPFDGEAFDADFGTE